MRFRDVNIATTKICASEIQAQCSGGVTEVIRGWGTLNIEADCGAFLGNMVLQGFFMLGVPIAFIILIFIFCFFKKDEF